MKIKGPLLLLFILQFCISCSSIRGFDGNANLCGLVTDSKNHPVSGYKIALDGLGFQAESAVSDSEGVFVIKNVQQGKYRLRGNAKNWEKISDWTVSFFDRKKLICIQIRSLDELLSQCEESLVLGDFSRALENLQCVSKDDLDEPIVCYYSALAHYKSGNFKEAEKILARLKSLNINHVATFYELARNGSLR